MAQQLKLVNLVHNLRDKNPLSTFTLSLKTEENPMRMNANPHFSLVLRFIIPMLFCCLNLLYVSAQTPQSLLSALPKVVPDSLFCEENYLQLFEKTVKKHNPVTPRSYFRADSAGLPQYICDNIDTKTEYPFINYAQNYVQWHDFEAIQPFFRKLEETSCRRLNILHIGDSHVQFDLITGTIRNRLQKAFGDGGRGMIFPLSILHTNTAYDYSTSYTGSWATAKSVQRRPQLALGVSGATIRTADSGASFKFRFHKQWHSIRKDFRKVKIFCKQHPESFDIAVKFSDEHPPITIDCSDSTCSPFVEVELPIASSNLEFLIQKNKPSQRFFECYGVSVESVHDQGVLYHSVGINGVGLSGILKQKLLPQQIRAINPDLVVVDLGVNDLVPFRTDMNYQEKKLQRLVNYIRDNSPKSSILITGTQDSYRRGVNIGECAEYAQVVQRVAKKNKCAFYNFYDVGGGALSMNDWRRNRLAQPDRLHLSSKGYQVKGRLYANALLNSYYFHLTENQKDSLVFKVIPKKKPIKKLDKSSEQILAKANTTKTTQIKSQKVTYKKSYQKTAYKKTFPKKITYTVENGDNLSYLSDKYNAYIRDIKRWNGLTNEKIRIGQKLTIYPNTAKTSKVIKAKTIKKYHTIRRGESLWLIARRYKTEVKTLKRLNGLRSNSLSVGQRLRVK